MGALSFEVEMHRGLERALGIVDPIEMASVLWPDVAFYRQQQEIIYSVADNDQTFVPAGNMLGKDFVAGFIALWFFLSRSPCRVITTSVDFTQLQGVLWGEIRRFIQTSRFPLNATDGGPLHINDLHIRKVVDGKVDGLSYLLGRVASKGEGMLGHHIANVGDGVPRTLFIADEASGVDDESYKRSETWAQRKLIIGNPYPCENFFKKGVTEGDSWSRDGKRCYRKVIRITAYDSPNVKAGHYARERGKEPPIIVPGVISLDVLEQRLATWDPAAICVSIDAQFYEGAEVRLYPPTWLDNAHRIAATLFQKYGPLRRGKGIGIDPAEGGDKTSMCAVDEEGVVELVSKKTPDTNVIAREAIAFMRFHNVPPERVVLDRGGGGKQIADQLRASGHPVRTVAFGEAVSQDPKRGLASIKDRMDTKEEKYAFVNRRAQMYGEVRELLDPSGERGGYGIPRGSIYDELRKQLAPIPLLYDGEGRLRLPPKSKRTSTTKEVTLTELIGHSPDEADAFVLAVHAMLHRSSKVRAGTGR